MQTYVEIVNQKDFRKILSEYNQENGTKYSLCFTRGTNEFYLQEFGVKSRPPKKKDMIMTKLFLQAYVLSSTNFPFGVDFDMYDGDHAGVYIFIAKEN